LRQLRIHLVGLAGLVVLLCSACPPPVEPAPKDLDGVIHWFWNNYLEADDASVGDAVNKLHKAVKGDSLDESLSGGVTRLVKDELAWVGLDHKDPSGAVGIYVVNLLDCDLGTIEEMVYELDQKRFFPEGYQSYDRRYTSDFEAYRNREEPFLTWHVDIDATISGGVINVPYSESIDGGIRYIPDIDDEATPFGASLLAHTYMPNPAVFEDDVNEWPLDFQISAYYERSPGKVVHLYGIWREMFFGGVGLGTEDTWVQNIQFDNLIAWADRLEEICATWPEVP